MSAAPNQAERQKCWSARDEFWKCLEENEKEPLKCLEQRKGFEGSCSKTWVKYFDRRRDYLKFKEKLEKGEADPIDQIKM